VQGDGGNSRETKVFYHHPLTRTSSDELIDTQAAKNRGHRRDYVPMKQYAEGSDVNMIYFRL